MEHWRYQDPQKFYANLERRVFGCRNCLYNNQRGKRCEQEKPGYPNNLKDECMTWRKRK